MDSTQFTTDEVDLDAYRARLRKMSDEELIREGKTGRYLCSPMANFGSRRARSLLFNLKRSKPSGGGVIRKPVVP
jgi:hypothetical protein